MLFYIFFIQKSFGLLLPFWIFSSSDSHSFLCSYSKRYKKFVSQLDGWIRKRLFLFIMSEVQEVEMHLYFKTNLQNHNFTVYLDHHMPKCFHKPILNTLLINIHNQNRLHVSQQKNKKTFTSSLLRLFLQVIVKRNNIN